MRNLQIINNLGSGGAEKLLKEMVPIMNKMDNIQVDILLLTNKDNVFYDSLVTKGIKVDIIKYNKLYEIKNIFEIAKFIEYGGYDIVHSHLFPTQYWVALSKIFIKNKEIIFITTEHNTHNRRREKIYFKIIDKFIYSKYDSIISITQKTKDNLIKWIAPNNETIDKYIVIENGIDLEKIEEARPYNKCDLIKGISEKVNLVCMVGRFSKQKDQPTLIRAISKSDKDIHLVLVGEGELMSDNKRLANQLGISDRVHFLGFRSDIPRILKTVDIVVLSSNWEGFGLAAAEGMAAKKPVIASDVDGLREVVNEAGLLFNNEKVLKYHIESLIEDRVLYEKVAEACFYRSHEYSIVKMVQNIVNLYSKKIQSS